MIDKKENKNLSKGIGLIICIVISIGIIGNFMIPINGNSMNKSKSEINQSSWKMYGNNKQNGFSSPYVSSHVNGSVNWKKNFDSMDIYPATPVMDSNSNIYMGTDQYVISLTSEGKIRWRFNSTPDFGPVSSSMAVDGDNNIIVPTEASSVYSLNSDGNLRWSFNTQYNNTNNIVFTAPVIDGNRILIGGADISNPSSQFGGENDYLYCLSLNGNLKWKYHTKGMIFSNPAVDSEGNVYFGTTNKTLYSLDKNGQLNWKYETGGLIHSSPSIRSDGTIYIGSDDHYLYAINSKGELDWKVELKGEIKSTSALSSDKTIYVGTNDKKLYAISQNGEIKWSHGTDKAVSLSPIIDNDGLIYFCSGKKYSSTLYSFNKNGTKRWAKEMDSLASSPIIGSDGTLYITTKKSEIYSLGPSSPTVDITRPTSGEVIKTKSVQLEWESTALGSDIDHFEVRLDGDDWQKIGSVDEYEFTDLAIGDHTAEVKAVAESNNYDVDSIEFTIEEDTTPPTADAGEDRTVKVDEEVTFDASDSSDNVEITSYEWDFDDGNTATGETVEHKFDEKGTYEVTLTVTDEAGNTDIDTINITVEKKKDNGGNGIPGFSIIILSLGISLAVLYKYRKRTG